MSEVDPRAWTTLGAHQPAYEGFIRVVHRRLRLPDGREATWDLLDTPATVTVLPLTGDGQVVTVSQFRPGPGRVVASLPGGIVDEGEEPLAAAVRELREETGYAPGPGGAVELVASVVPTNALRPWHVVVARDCALAGGQDLDELEDIEVHLLTVDRLREELRAGRLAAAAQTYLALDHAGLL